MEDEAKQMLVFSTVAVLGDPQAGDPQITFHTSIERDAPLSELNDAVDKVMRVLERQKALSAIASGEKQIRLLKKEIGKHDAGAEERERDYKERSAAYRERAQELQSQLPSIREADAVAWASSGRAGQHKLSNTAQSKINAIEKQVRELNAQLLTLNTERATAFRNRDAGLAMLEARIADEEEEIARLKQIVDGAPTPRLKAVAG